MASQVQVWKWWKDAAQEARQARFAATAFERRMALERPGSAQVAAAQLHLGSEPAPCAAGDCYGADPEQEAWKAELQVRASWAVQAQRRCGFRGVIAAGCKLAWGNCTALTEMTIRMLLHPGARLGAAACSACPAAPPLPRACRR